MLATLDTEDSGPCGRASARACPPLVLHFGNILGLNEPALHGLLPMPGSLSAVTVALWGTAGWACSAWDA
eukprot:scaffold110723_cov18-Tisochrysis_lutea.AAC.1